jgi:hypothetical protein
MSYKVGVKTPGDRDWVTNAVRFKTQKEAKTYGRDLSMRWTAVTDTTIIRSRDAVNYMIVDGQLLSVGRQILERSPACTTN